MSPATPLDAAPSSLKRDLLWAYAASASKILAWATVSALLYRHNPADFALFALLRATIGILNYTSLGLAPAMIRLLATAPRRDAAAPREGEAPSEPFALREPSDLSRDGHQTAPDAPSSPPRTPSAAPPTGGADILVCPDPPVPILSYSTARRPEDAPSPFERIVANGMLVGLICAAVGALLAVAYGQLFARLHSVPMRLQANAPWLVMMVGFGMVIRLSSDAAGAALQARGQIALDNRLLVMTEVLWLVLFALERDKDIVAAGTTYLLASVALWIGRAFYLGDAVRFRSYRLAHWPTMRALLGYGAIVTIGQLADFLYAPIDYVLINRLLGYTDLAAYAPAVQIDAALLILVAGLAAVLLPRAALAHAQGAAGRATIWRYYLRGTLASAALLTAAACAVWLAAPVLLKLWLGDPMPATQAILPLVLIHTVAGGSSAVGRSILLATGHAKAFTISVLIAGVANVVLSYVFVRHFDMGLRGIVLGTITVVTARCLIWMPWYVYAALKRDLDKTQTDR
ncbi:MAG TPA: oligosaccharide flippase family protein [Tepidisphaeraceae bacterium]|nr:oligosaccharide flippase family protein [Tepidisphaeraceae bacterium]